MNKKQIRKQARACRDAISPAERSTLSARICQRVLTCLAKLDLSRVALYASIGSEVHTEKLFTELRERNIPVLFPRCVPPEQSLEFAPVQSLDELEPGCHRLLEPQGKAVDLQADDVVVMPGLAFDVGGARLGYGAGYYDRALRDFEGVRLGLAFDCQIFSRLPQDLHDETVHAVITESRVLKCREGVCPS